MKVTPLFFLIAAGAVPASAQPVDVLPVRATDGAQSVNGEWKFQIRVKWFRR